MATSIRLLAYSSVSLVADIPFTLDLDGFEIPETTLYVSVFVPEAYTEGVYAVEPGSPESESGEFIPAGTRWSDGPFRKTDLPDFVSPGSGTIYISLKPVVSER